MTNYDYKLSAGKWDEEMRQTQTYKERRVREGEGVIFKPHH